MLRLGRPNGLPRSHTLVAAVPNLRQLLILILATSQRLTLPGVGFHKSAVYPDCTLTIQKESFGMTIFQNVHIFFWRSPVCT